jgi:hypothetical protein
MVRRSPPGFTNPSLRPGTSSGERGDCTQSTFPCRRTARIRLVAGSSTQRSPSNRQRPRRKQGRIGARINACDGRNSQECAPAQKPKKFFPAYSAPRSAPSAFSEEDIPARTVPRFIPDRDNSRGSGQLRIARWDSIETVKRFAGPNPDAAIVKPEGRSALTEFDDFASHYEVPYSYSCTARHRRVR